MKRQMLYLGTVIAIVGLGMYSWKLATRFGYESAEYQTVESDGDIEIREYPDLMLASTDSNVDSQGRDGSFMRLFRYISGANEEEQKIAMTTPVFMEGEVGTQEVSMGFVVPKEVSATGVPAPRGPGVSIRKRDGGLFAVIRFSGQLDSQSIEQKELELRDWMQTRGLSGEPNAESAGYDPPFTPGPLRRNEVLIRLIETANTRIAS